jgi:hypothetical protein
VPAPSACRYARFVQEELHANLYRALAQELAGLILHPSHVTEEPEEELTAPSTEQLAR